MTFVDIRVAKELRLPQKPPEGLRAALAGTLHPLADDGTGTYCLTAFILLWCINRILK
jgi:hypothetical protein